MIKTLIFDSTPLGLVTQRPGKPDADQCLSWVETMLQAGHSIIVPEIIDYEVRRELTRSRKTASLRRLDNFVNGVTGRYLPITTPAMRLAADLWAQMRNAGLPTADPKALDADVILVAQALQLGLPPAEMIVATGNVRHITRFVAADLWTNIVP